MKYELEDTDKGHATYEVSGSSDDIRETNLNSQDEYDESRYVESNWCYDTPGLINPDQVRNDMISFTILLWVCGIFVPGLY